MANLPSPLVSVITPCFNCTGKIDATVESVLGQSGVTVEHIVVDGGSTDGTLDRLRRYGTKLRWVSEADAGIYDAMNKGIALARGEFLFFLGAGDLLRPGILQEVAHVLPSDRDGLLLYGDVYRCDTQAVYGGRFNRFRLFVDNVCHQAAFYHRRIFELVGKYDLDYPTHADHAHNIRCFGHRKIRAVYVPLLISDFEGAGASNHADEAFIRAWPDLVRREFGRFYYLCFLFRRSRLGRSLAYRCELLRRSLPASN